MHRALLFALIGLSLPALPHAPRLADDEIGYIIPKSEWDDQAPWLQNASKRWYGEVNSIGPEAAPMIVHTMQELLRSK